MKKILLVLFISFLLCGCSRNDNKFDELMEDGNYIIVDVRTSDEFNVSHIKGAINIPYDEIDVNKLSKEKTIFVYCRSGARSKIAFDKLTAMGYEVYDLGAFDSIDLPKE